MMLISLMVGLSAAAFLLTAGYLLGARRGYQAREDLRQQSLRQASELYRLRGQEVPDRDAAGLEVLSKNLEKMIEPLLLRQGDAMMQKLEPLLQNHTADDGLRATIQQTLTPLLQRERLAFELSNRPRESSRHDDLTALLDQIAEKGNFGEVLLSDEAGWPLASNTQARNLDRLTAISSHLLVLTDRIRRDNSPAPLSLMVHDEANQVTLCRIFKVSDQRLVLTAVSTGAHLTSTALDPALVKVDAVLTT